MKKSLLLLASMLMSAASFAQWTKPVPAFEPMADDGETVQYLYNVEAGSFFLGANDWGTRASASKTEGHPVKMTAMYEDEEKTVPLGTWAIYDAVKGDENNWQACSPDGWNGIWVDGGRAGYDAFLVQKLDANKYAITHATLPGLLALFDKFNGAEDTRLYMFAEKDNEELYDADEQPRWEGVHSVWAFVSPEEYEAIQPKMVVYNAAMKLEAAINSAKESYPGIDIAAAEAVYNNTESTVEQLEDATNNIIPAAIVDFQKNQASAENPADFTDLVPSHDFESGVSGWLFTTGAQNKGGATNKANANDYPGTTMTGTFLENWNPEPFAGKIYTELTDLPGGIYRLEMDATANGGTDTWVYANKSITRTGGVDANGEGDKVMGDTAYKFHVMTCLNDGETLEIGLENKSACCNWIGIDNVKLTYYGAELDAYKLWYQTVRAEIIDKMNAKITPETHYDRNQKAIFEKALAEGDAASTKEALMQAVETLADAADAVDASLDAYAALEAAVEHIEEVLNTKDVAGLVEYFADLLHCDASESGKQEISDLMDEIKGLQGADEIAGVSYAPNYVLNEGIYNAEEIKTYTENLEKLFDFCVANSVAPGDDYTYVIKDADFKDPNGTGWTREKGSITWRGGFYAFPVAESYHSAFNFYQEVSAPDGIYSLSLNGFCRPDDDETEPAAEIYLNDFATKFQSLSDGALPESECVDGFNSYLTINASEGVGYMANPIFAENPTHSSPANNPDKLVENGYQPDGMEGASIAFSAGRYEAKVYGIVEGGKMKLGARCSSTHQWVLWGNFKLTYEGKTKEAVSALGEKFAADASAYLENNQENMTEKMAATLEDAIKAVNDADGDPETQYDAIIALNKIVNVEAPANVAAVSALQAANDELTAALEDYAGTASPEAVEKASELADNYDSYQEMNNEQIAAFTEEIKAATAALKIPNEPASDSNPVDFTQVIINPDFQANSAGQQATGWTLVKGEGASGNYQVQNGFDGGVSMEFWSATNGSGTRFDFYQDIVNLPAGTYEITADAANSLNGQQPGDGTGAAYLYAASVNGSKINYVNGDPIAVQEEGCADAYNNYSVIIKIAEGETLRIGVKNVDQLSARWVMIDNFQLTYYGANSSKTPSTGTEVVIEDVNVVAGPAAIYSISGAKLNTLKKGINIVKGADGSVRKVYVK